jgi:hypothetical protein
MSVVTQIQLLKILKLKCEEVAAARVGVNGYREELMKHLSEIVAAERSHLAQKQVSDKVDTLGQIIYSESATSQK